VDYGRLAETQQVRSAQHVLRVIRRDEGMLSFVDDSGESKPTSFAVPLDRVHRAVLAIPDGFWMIGSRRDLDLPGAMPWTPNR
jgi:hypothetical protein